MLYYDRIDLGEGIALAKSNNSKECIVCHYWYFNHEFKFQKFFCYGCHDLLTLCLNISNITIVIIKSIDYLCIIYGVSKSDAIHLLKHSVLVDRGYI